MRLSTPLLMTLGLMLTCSAQAKVLEESTERYPFDSDGSISVENINGSIEISTWNESDIEFTYVITGNSQKDRDRIEVEVRHSSDRFDVETEHKSSGFGWNSGGGSASYSLKVPEGVTLKLIDTVNGSIRINGQFAEVQADTVNGDITVEGRTGDINLDTVNGSIELTLQSLDDQQITMDSVNGRLELYIPDSLDARISADTVHGSIRNDFGMEVDKGWVGQELKATLGNGRAVISMDTVNGAIEIRKR